MSNEHAGEATKRQTIWAMTFGGRQLDGYLTGFEGENWIAQPFPGANHALWQVGHLALSAHGIGGYLGDMGEIPGEYDALFNMGTDPSESLAKYPDPQSVVDQFHVQRERLIKVVGDLPAASVHDKVKDEGMFKTPAELLAFIPIHDATHAGQLAMIRKHLGMPRVFG